MMKSLAVALLAGVVLLAGCRNVETQPQTGRATVAQPSEPAAEPVSFQREQPQSCTTASQPNEAKTQQVGGVEEDKAATAETSQDGVSCEAKTENIGLTEGAAPVQAEPVATKAPVRGETHEPNEAKPIRPSDVRSTEPIAVKPSEPATVASAPADANDAAAAVFKEYAEILKTYVREDGRVDYGGLRRRRLNLKPLLMKLGEMDPNAYQRWSRDEKLAFWINAYNLKMLDIVTRNYPIQSSWWLRLTWPPDDIRHIRGIWTDFKLMVMDEEFTLAEVERHFFQKTFADPRVYLALTCASQSSPLLRLQPFRGDNLDRQLDEQVKQFLSNPQGLQIDRRSMVVRLSALFKPTWRGREFVSRYGTDKKFKNQDPETRAVLNFMLGYLPRDDVYFLEVENYAIEYMPFDWRLNDTARGY
jgi:hypothetical protein